MIPIGWEFVMWVGQPETSFDRWRIAECERQLMNLSVHVYARQLLVEWFPAWVELDG